MNDQLKYLIALSMIQSVGSITARKLIAYTGSAEAVFKERKSALLKIPGIGSVLAERTSSPDLMVKAKKELEFCEKKNIQILSFYDKEFPLRLKTCEDAPLILYYKGENVFSKSKIISMVGTRKASPYGIDLINKFLSELSEKFPDVVIVSGLAYGIDYHSHKTALKYGLKTVAVLAHGLHTVYPWEHKNIALKIRDNGCLLSDFTSWMDPERNNFIKRNRIIAGLSDATIVVESGVKGGSLITADIAGSYNRDVFAFPGRVNDDLSSGCNQLIKNHKAGLIENCADLEYFMSWSAGSTNKNEQQRSLFVELTEEEERVLSYLKTNEKCSIDKLSIKLNIPLNKLSALMLNLEFEGLVRVLPGNLYKFP
jgi:DNA processing protein